MLKAVNSAHVSSISVKTIQRLIEDGTNVNAKEEEGTTILMCLVGVHYSFRANLQAVNMLIKYGADVNAKNDDGYTALYVAVTNDDNLEVIKA